jgi:hypothetical protein
MSPNHEVISDFLDGEAFDPQALGEALADPTGRDILIDFVVLRYAAQADDPVVAQSSARRPPNRLLLAAAAVLVALVGGYQLGQRQAEPDSTRPPAATRVVPVDWHTVPAEESAK